MVMVTCTAVDVPDAFETETLAVPGKAASDGRIAAVSCVELTRSVVRAVPIVEGFVALVQLTTAPFVKFWPFTVSVKPFGLQ